MSLLKARSSRIETFISAGIDQIQAELTEAGGKTIRCEIHKLIIVFGIRRNCQRSGRNRSSYLSIGRAMKETVIIIVAYHFYQLRTQFYPTSCCLG